MTMTFDNLNAIVQVSCSVYKTFKVTKIPQKMSAEKTLTLTLQG
jgi:hypothetical protein